MALSRGHARNGGQAAGGTPPRLICWSCFWFDVFFGCQRAFDHFCCSENTNSQESIAGSFIPLLQKIWLVGSNNVALLPNSRIWNSWLLLDGILGAWSDVLFLCAPKIVPLQRYIKKKWFRATISHLRLTNKGQMLQFAEDWEPARFWEKEVGEDVAGWAADWDGNWSNWDCLTSTIDEIGIVNITFG